MIVRLNARLEITFARVDEDGDVVNPTPVSIPLGKLTDQEWQRVKGTVEQKQAELTAVVDRLADAAGSTGSEGRGAGHRQRGGERPCW